MPLNESSGLIEPGVVAMYHGKTWWASPAQACESAFFSCGFLKRQTLKLDREGKEALQSWTVNVNIFYTQNKNMYVKISFIQRVTFKVATASVDI